MNYLIESLSKRFPDPPVQEDNVTSGAEAYEVPFTDDEPDKVEEMLDRIMLEINYNEFRKDDSKSNRQKINTNIKHINSMLREVEQLITHAAKLKTESGANHSVFWKGTSSQFLKIRERLNRLNSKILEINT